MEQDEMAVKSKAKKDAAKKGAAAMPVEKEVGPVVIEAYGMRLTLDNSLKHLANHPVILKKVEEAERLFSQKKSNL